MIKNAAAGLLLLVASVAGCGSRNPEPSAKSFQGVVEYEERALAFELGGRLQRVAVRRGEVVADGQLLAEIDDTLERIAREVRTNDTEAARADVALLEAGARKEDVASLAAQARGAAAVEGLLRKTAERTRSLHEAGAISRAEIDRAEAELERATAERRALEARLASLQRGARTEEIARARSRAESSVSALSLADERIVRHSLKAVGGGEVLDVHLEPGELAAAGAPVVTLADTTHPYVEVFVPQAELRGIRTGAKASVRVDAERVALPGAVEHVSSRTEFTPRFVFSERERANLVVRVRVRVEDPERRMHAGVPAFVTIER